LFVLLANVVQEQKTAETMALRTISLILLGHFFDHVHGIFTPQEAIVAWENVRGYLPTDANTVHDLCGQIGYTSVDCANTFLSNDQQGLLTNKQAVINCMNKVENSRKEVNTLLAALNVNYTKMGLYASGSGATLHRPLGCDDHGICVYRDPSPADRKLAMQRAQAEGPHYGEQLLWGSSALIEITAAVLGARGGSSGSIAAGIAAGKVVIGKFLPSKEEAQKEGTQILTGLATENPSFFLQPDELHGICADNERECDDGTGGKYPNPHYKAPSTPSGGQASGGSTSHSVPTHTPDPSDPDTDVNSNPTGIIDLPDYTPISSDGPAWVEPDPNFDKNAFMTDCVRDEQTKIIREIGTIKKVGDADGIHETEAEKKKNAEGALLWGMCDKDYYGEAFCKEWKQKQFSTPLDPDVQFALDTAKQLQSCHDPFRLCMRPIQELWKRYDTNQQMDQLTGILSGSRIGLIIRKVIPVHFGQDDGFFRKFITILSYEKATFGAS
jgi:hypothetical protein